MVCVGHDVSPTPFEIGAVSISAPQFRYVVDAPTRGEYRGDDGRVYPEVALEDRAVGRGERDQRNIVHCLGGRVRGGQRIRRVRARGLDCRAHRLYGLRMAVDSVTNAVKRLRVDLGLKSAFCRRQPSFETRLG